jgi:DNA-binding MarR family transcriptional regulator
MTPKQTELYTFLKAYQKKEKTCARIKDIMEHFNISRPWAVDLLNSLIEIGKVEKLHRAVYRPK